MLKTGRVAAVRRNPSGMLTMIRARALGICLAAPLLLTACPRQGHVPAGQDPEKVSRGELDVAQDEWKHGRLRPAMEHAQKASAADESHAAAHEFVAILYLALCQIEGDCRFDDAEKYARKAAAADPENRSAKHLLGSILVNEKKWDDAIVVLLPLADDFGYKTPELAWYDLGAAFLGKGDADKAVDALSKAVALKPTFCWANYRLGLAFEKKGDLSRAEEELSKAVEPEAPACKNLQFAYEARGRIRRRLGQKDLAKEDFRTCMKLDASTVSGRACAASLL
jgi:type IV pilus assembly protein PilF